MLCIIWLQMLRPKTCQRRTYISSHFDCQNGIHSISYIYQPYTSASRPSSPKIRNELCPKQTWHISKCYITKQETFFCNRLLHTSFYLSKFIQSTQPALQMFCQTTIISYNKAHPVLFVIPSFFSIFTSILLVAEMILLLSSVKPEKSVL